MLLREKFEEEGKKQRIKEIREHGPQFTINNTQ